MTRKEARLRLNSMSEQDLLKWKMKMGYDVCPRCSGTGKYSYCTLYGNTCFKCNGLGYVPLTNKELKARGWRK